MDKQITRFITRRQYRFAILAALIILSVVLTQLYSLSLHRTGYFTGWLLILLILGLALFNVRKKLPFLPFLQSNKTWLQIHIYAGLFSIFMFALHTKFRVPNGWLEGTLAVLFLIVALSGVFGLFLSREIPGRLTTRGEEVIFERIPVFLNQLRDELEQLVSRAIAETDSATIADFYAHRLIHFFHKPRNIIWHLVQSNRPRFALLNELKALSRYLSPAEQAFQKEISELIEVKDNLDYHYAHQAILKYWLFVHIPLTYSLLLFAIVHAVLVYVYRGGIG